MIHFLSPAWLFSLLALAVPIAIHLLSRKTGKIIKVGSIRFLESSQSAQLRSIRLSEMSLLLVRAAMVAILCGLLAAPVWHKNEEKQNVQARGWVLVAPELLSNVENRELRVALDSLAAAGHEVHLFAQDFPRQELEDTPSVSQAQENYWSLLREIDHLLSPSAPLRIFSADRLGNFHGERPTLGRTVEWCVVSRKKQNRWFEHARYVNGDSVQLLLGSSDARQTTFQRFTAHISNRQSILSGTGFPPIELIPGDDGEGARLNLISPDDYASDNRINLSKPAHEVNVEFLYDTERKEDARYVRAALEAAMEYSKLPVVVKSRLTGGDDRMWQNASIIFWLSSAPAPAEMLRYVQEKGALLISDAASREYERCESVIVDDRHIANSALRRRVAANNAGITMWTDGFGTPLLVGERLGVGLHYRFYSRFHLSWNDLVLDEGFPVWILSLLEYPTTFVVGAPSVNGGSDQRRISEAQVLQRTNTNTHAAAPQPMTINLHLPFLLSAVLLFILERRLAERRAA